MQIEELWEKIQHEFVGVRTDINRLEENVASLNEKTDRLEKNVDKLNETTARLEENVASLNEKTDRLEENFDNLNERTGILEEKMDVMANVNLAKILEQQTEMRKELNEKMDKYMLQNNLEHKQFAFQIARLEKEHGIFTKIG